MIQQILPDLDLNELREFPNLQKSHLKLQAQALSEGQAEGERTKARDAILEVIAPRFNPPLASYRHIDAVLDTIDSTERLSALFTAALSAATFAEFEAEIGDQ